jgi:hypothetical protein
MPTHCPVMHVSGSVALRYSGEHDGKQAKPCGALVQCVVDAYCTTGGAEQPAYDESDANVSWCGVVVVKYKRYNRGAGSFVKNLPRHEGEPSHVPIEHVYACCSTKP